MLAHRLRRWPSIVQIIQIFLVHRDGACCRMMFALGTRLGARG